MKSSQNGHRNQPTKNGRECGGDCRQPFGRFRSAASAGALTATLHRPKGTPPRGLDVLSNVYEIFPVMQRVRVTALLSQPDPFRPLLG
jgi:hypothetical protein